METTKMTYKEDLQKEIDNNYDSFKQMAFEAKDKGKFALLQGGQLVEIMSSKEDCHKLAQKTLGGKPYSIQEILPDKKDLGFMSYALC